MEVFGVCVLVALLFSMSLKLKRAEAVATANAMARDSLAIDAAKVRAERDGWKARFGETANVGAQLESSDERSRRLAHSLAEANAEIVSLTKINATLSDSMTVLAASQDTADSGEVTYRGQINDGLLTASWRFTAPALGLDYSASVPVEIVTSRGGDGRWLVTARATDPRASVSVPAFYIDPPDPMTVQHCSLGAKAKYVGVGGALFGGIRLIFGR